MPRQYSQPKKRRGCPKKAETTEAAAPVPPDAPEQVVVKAQRRGRPKKAETTEAAIKLSPQDEALIEETISANDVSSLLEDEPQPRSRSIKNRNPAFCYLEDFPVLDSLKMGQAYEPYAFLYRWQDKLLLSPCVLSGMMPIGVYIPYKNLVFGKYRGFIISIYDEAVSNNVYDAIANAQASFPPIDGEEWNVMDSLQWGCLKNCLGIPGRMMNKVGGDALKNSYKIVSPGTCRVLGQGGFRYAINVK